MNKQEYPPERCYENAWLWADKNRDRNESLLIVHGYPIQANDGKLIGHAWIESGDYCIDPTIDRTFPKGEYYAKHKIDERLCTRYTLDEALWQYLRLKNYGPWNEIPPVCYFPNRRQKIVKRGHH